MSTELKEYLASHLSEIRSVTHRKYRVSGKLPIFFTRKGEKDSEDMDQVRISIDSTEPLPLEGIGVSVFTKDFEEILQSSCFVQVDGAKNWRVVFHDLPRGRFLRFALVIPLEET